MARPDGFPRQRIAIVPRPLVAEADARPITRRLQVTDAGWFPNARGHERSRPGGAAESVIMLCVAGSGWVELAGARHAVQAPAIVALPAGTAHRYGASDEKHATGNQLNAHDESPSRRFFPRGTNPAAAEAVRRAVGDLI